MSSLSARSYASFIGIRHEWLGPHLTQQALGMKLDKWQIGPLRVINLVTFTIVFYWLRKYVLRAVSVEPFLTLGKASLHVFCAHVFFVFVGLALLYSDVPELHGWPALALLAVTFAGLVLVAVREVRKQRAARIKSDAKKNEASSQKPHSVQLRAEVEPLSVPLQKQPSEICQ